MENMNETVELAVTEALTGSDSKYQKKGKAVTEDILLKYISKISKMSCKDLLTNVLWVWYSKSNLPVGLYAAFIGAIGYFVAPIDLVTDALPVLGLMDDAAVLGGFIKLAKGSLTPEALQMAKMKVESIFNKHKNNTNDETVVDTEVVAEEVVTDENDAEEQNESASENVIA